MRSYEAARGLFSFLGFCSWFVIIVGGIVAFGGMSVGSSLGRNAGVMQALIGAAPGFILAMAGFYGLALVQMGRAGVDSAEYAQQALDVSRKQLEVAQQLLQRNKQLATSYNHLQQNGKASAPASATVAQPPDSTGPSYGQRSETPTDTRISAEEAKAATDQAKVASTAPELEHTPAVVMQSNRKTSSPADRAEEYLARLSKRDALK